jgi:hypothetical protein
MTTFTMVVSQTVEVDFDPAACGSDDPEQYAARLATAVANEKLKITAPGLHRLTIIGTEVEIVV